MIKQKNVKKSIKTILLFGALSVVVLLVVVGLAFLLQSSYYKHSETSLVGKRIIVADDDQHLLVIDNTDGLSFRYSIEEWRYKAESVWGEYDFSDRVTPSDFKNFHGVSAFPDSDRVLIFSVIGSRDGESVSLFSTLDIRSRKVLFFDDIIEGEVGNIVWSPTKDYFAYFANSQDQEGIFLAINDINEAKETLRVKKEDLFSETLVTDYQPGFRMMQWSEDQEELFFTVNNPEKESEFIRVSLSIVDGEVSVLEQ